MDEVADIFNIPEKTEGSIMCMIQIKQVAEGIFMERGRWQQRSRNACLLVALIFALAACHTTEEATSGTAGERQGMPRQVHQSRDFWAASLNNADTFYNRGIGTYRHGVVNSEVLNDRGKSPSEVGYTIYLPPEYHSTDKRYPVLYFAHGMGGNENTSAVVVETAHRLIEDGSLDPFIIVSTNARSSFYGNQFEEMFQFHDYFMHEFIPYIDENYRTLPGKAFRHIQGFSMGGYGALMFAARHPFVFSAATNIAGALSGARHNHFKAMYNEDEENYRPFDVFLLAEENTEVLENTAISIWIGENDICRPVNEHFHSHLADLGISHHYNDWRTHSGLQGMGHNLAAYYQAYGEEILRFHGEAFQKAVDCFREPRSPSGGILYYEGYDGRDETAAVENPYIIGAFFQLYWSEIEKEKGLYDWSEWDRRIQPWIDAGKKIALRFMFVSSGNWPLPAASRPTPQWVWDEGAKYVTYEKVYAELPLFWDPVYMKYKQRFMEEVARKFDNDPNVLFIDVTPGAETNPYRFRVYNQWTPEFQDIYASTPASDGRTYSNALWLEAVKQHIGQAAVIFEHVPLLVTLNNGGIRANNFHKIGEFCMDRCFYVGQNGLSPRSHPSDSQRRQAIEKWSADTRIFFEMVDATGDNLHTLLRRWGRPPLNEPEQPPPRDTLLDYMKRAVELNANYLNVYGEDVLKGTRGHPDYDPAWEAALRYGAKHLGTLDAESGVRK